MLLEKDFTFDSAHYLASVDDNHKCGEIHGHTYLVTIGIEAEVDKKMGWLMDFGEVKQIVNPIIDFLDHKMLNNIEGLENSTAEYIAIYIYNKIKPDIPSLTFVRVQETPTARCTYYGK